MATRTRTNGTAATERRLKEGRGQGRGCDYKPWLQIHDVPSHGQANRVKSPLSGRTCHLLSKLETDWFFAFHALSGLTDVREQFPLLPLEETQSIAENLGIAHPTDPRCREACVVTTDFVLTFRDSLRDTDLAVAIKPTADLASERALEKLEIERIYWAARNTSWRILTERQLPREVVRNMRWLVPHRDLADNGELAEATVARIRTVIDPAVREGKAALSAIAADCDDRLGLDFGLSLTAARHLIATGAWAVDLTVEIDPRQPIHLVPKGEAHASASTLTA